MPLTLYCHAASPEQAYAFLDEMRAVLKGDRDKWQATYIFEEGGLFRKKRSIIHINYDREFCSAPNWPKQMAGMKNFLSGFDMDADRTAAVMRLVDQFQFTLGIVLEPEIGDSGEDMRLDVVHALAEELGATIFTPGALLDSHFRPFFEMEGDVDPDAVMPAVAAAGGAAAGVEPLATIQLAPDADTHDKDDWEPDPPDAQTVARRLYAMVGLAARGLYDMNVAQGQQPAYSLDDLTGYIDAIGVTAQTDGAERRILNTPGGKLPQQDTINSVWCLEGLAVLAWSLGLADLPRYDEVVETDKLLDALRMGDVEFARQTIDSATLRPRAELDKYAEHILLFHWRMVDFRVRPQAINFHEVKIWGEPDLSWASLIDDDLVIRGAPISLADADAVSMAGSIAMERHKASNWLAGYDPVYSQVDTST